MRRFIFLLIIFASCQRNAPTDESTKLIESTEFKTYSSGLIYDHTTMAKLATIVDSMNLKFRSCDLDHPYFSLPQGTASFVDIPNKVVLQEISKGISFESFEKKFPHLVKHRSVWIFKRRYDDYDGNRQIRYSGLPNDTDTPSITVDDTPNNDKNPGWIVSKWGNYGCYIEKLETSVLPSSYARLIQYVDCMIDTSTQIYSPLPNAESHPRVSPTSRAYAFIEWSENFPGKPTEPEYGKQEDDKLFYASMDKYYLAYKRWDSSRLLHLDRQMHMSQHAKDLLADAVDESLAEGYVDERLEFYAERYYSKQKALRLMRGRRVMGRCSQDQSPRDHAVKICKLAAETTQWDIFLRAHLDIMNDHFERMSDGSYAWEQRRTYFRELEELDIAAVDLLIGSCLRSSNVSSGHYFGSVGRIGRALADASNKDEVEGLLLAMIYDDKLDHLNRLLMAYVMRNYIEHVEDTDRQMSSRNKLEDAVKAMPEEVKQVW